MNERKSKRMNIELEPDNVVRVEDYQHEQLKKGRRLSKGKAVNELLRKEGNADDRSDK